MWKLIAALTTEYGQYMIGTFVTATLAFFKRKSDLRKIQKKQEERDKLKHS